MCKKFATTIPNPNTFTSIFVTKYSNVNPFATVSGNATQINWISNPLDVYPIVGCADTNSTTKF